MKKAMLVMMFGLISSTALAGGYESGQGAAKRVWINDYAEDCTQYDAYRQDVESRLDSLCKVGALSYRQECKRGANEYVESLRWVCMSSSPTPEAECSQYGFQSAQAAADAICFYGKGKGASTPAGCRKQAMNVCIAMLPVLTEQQCPDVNPGEGMVRGECRAIVYGE